MNDIQNIRSSVSRQYNEVKLMILATTLYFLQVDDAGSIKEDELKNVVKLPFPDDWKQHLAEQAATKCITDIKAQTVGEGHPLPPTSSHPVKILPVFTLQHEEFLQDQSNNEARNTNAYGILIGLII
jgi:hypothetical protein